MVRAVGTGGEMDVEQSVALQPTAGSIIGVYTIGFVCLVAESVGSYALVDIDIRIDRRVKQPS